MVVKISIGLAALTGIAVGLGGASCLTSKHVNSFVQESTNYEQNISQLQG